MRFVYNDGGRSKYFRGTTGDCVTRAIAIASGQDYKTVYDHLFDAANKTPRNGVCKTVYAAYLESLDFTWYPTMSIGSGCRVHLCAEEIPTGRVIVRLSKHLCAVLDSVIHDIYDPSRDGTRCVYGYWIKSV